MLQLSIGNKFSRGKSLVRISDDTKEIEGSAEKIVEGYIDMVKS